jgi:hypothetical protein
VPAVISLQRYANRSGNSGVPAFRIFDHAIVVQFGGGAVCRYSKASAGSRHLATPKQLARASAGLATFITQHRDSLDYER